MRVAWTDEAKAHLDGIYQYIKRDAPFYATQTVGKLTRRVDQLIDHPRSGRIVPKYDDENLRELIAHPTTKGLRRVSGRYRRSPDREHVLGHWVVRL